MRLPAFNVKLREIVHAQALRTDLSRATRATIGFMVPLLVGPALDLPVEVFFVALAAQNIAMVDVRGAYSLRVAVLVAMTFILGAYAAAGALCGESIPGAMAVTLALTLLTGLWRHLSTDYGPSLSISSLLMLFLALAGKTGAAPAEQHMLSTLVGGALGLLLQVGFWPIRPQHPLRRTVAESWLAAADLFDALGPVAREQAQARHTRVVDAENAWRAAIDKAALLIIQASAKRTSPMLQHLEELNLCAARVAVRVVALNTAMEGAMSDENLARAAPAMHPVLTALKNTARTVGLVVVSRHPSQLAAARVRLRRTTGLLRVLRTQLRSALASSTVRGQLEDLLEQIEEQLPEIGRVLGLTMERADERAAFSVELFDVDTWMLRPLAASLNLRWQIEPALIRYAFRLATLTTAGVWVFKSFQIAHGYWLPFTAVVVLQPDFGATRQRAAQRVGGTLAGSLIASALVAVHFPAATTQAIIALCVFSFAYVVRRHYGVAIFFVTIFVVLLMESAGANDVRVIGERVGATLAGGSLAFLAAAIFWPLWERDRLPGLLGDALRKNAAYFEVIADHLVRGAERGPELLAAKRGAEIASSSAFASLRRMLGDPKNQREGIERAAALANGNQRITRILNVVFVHLTRPGPKPPQDVEAFSAAAASLLRVLADEIERRSTTVDTVRAAAAEMAAKTPVSENDSPVESDERAWLAANFARIATELSAMSLAAEAESEGGGP